MARVKVWNDNVHDHKEEFKGEMIEIPSKGYVEMDYEDAVEFRGKFFSMIIRADGTHDPKGYKMIRVDKPALSNATPLVNHATGQTYATEAELKAALEEFKHLRAVDKDLELSIPKQDDGKLAELQAQIEELKALVQGAPKKKPGPKPGFRKEAAG